MKELDPQFRARAREWADRSPRRSAAEAARRARTASRAPGHSPARRLALAALAVGLVALVGPTDGRDELAAARPAAVAAPAPAPRLIVIELASGTRLYVALTPETPKRRPT